MFKCKSVSIHIMIGALLGIFFALAACSVPTPVPTAAPAQPATATAAPTAAPAPQNTATNAPLKKVSIGMSSSASWIPVQVAANRGFFKKNGIDVQIQILASAPDTAKALVAGELNFAALAVERGIQTTQQGKKVYSVVALQNTPPSAIVIPPDSDLKPGDFKALKGKTVGIVPGGWSELMLREMLKRNGMVWEDVKTLNTPNPATMLASLKNKQVDALSAIEPSQSQALATNAAKVFFDLEDPTTLQQSWPNPFIATTLQATEAYLTSHPEETKAVTQSVLEGLQYVRDHADEVAAEWAANNPDTPKEVWTLTVKRLVPGWSRDGKILPEALRNVETILVANGIIDKAATFEDTVYQPK